MRIFLVVLTTLSLLPACTSPPTDVLEATTAITTTEYTDNLLCFRVETATDWFVDGVAGGFAYFMDSSDEAAFNMTRVYLGLLLL